MTHTLSAKEQPLAKIFSDEYMFSIPAYQRPYSWGRDQAQELLDDLLGYMRDAGKTLGEIPPYFLGSLVLIKGESSPAAQVVNGQQRLTTLTLLLACIRSVVKDENVRRGITRRIYDQGDIVSATDNHYRLTLRERDMQFFRERVQHEGGIEKLVSGDESLPDSQARLRENARYFMSVLTNLDAPLLVRLVQFIVTRCYLVAVATPDLDSAYRIFGVMNSRGLDLSATDILKAEIIGAVPEAARSGYTEKWEGLESDLGRDSFGELFSHIRMVYRKAKPQGTLLKEFREHVGPSDPRLFVDKVLSPMAQAYREISDADHASTRHAEAINDSLRWLNRLEFKDWMPPALAYFTRHSSNPDALLSFVAGLERLAYSMLVRKAGVNERIERFSRLTAAVEAGDDLEAAGSPLQLPPAEQHEMFSMLEGPLYRTHSARALGLILLRIDALASDGSMTMQHQQVTVEHVLPQQPRPDSVWVKWMPSEQERQGWVHRLGNLALLNRKKNSAASNYDFDRKKQAYFSKGGACAFPLTTQVLKETQWDANVLHGRQAALLKLAEDHWQLAGRARVAAPAVKPDADSPVFVLGGLNQQIRATGQQVDGQFVVFAGSRARADWVGVDVGYRVLHQDLIENGSLAPAVGESREFLRDTWFSSPSAAAAVVWGRSANGRLSWREEDTGRSYAEWEEGVPAGEHEPEEGDDDAREEVYRRFWDQFLVKANARGTLFQRRNRSSNPWLGVGIGRSGFRFNVAMTRAEARVSCLIHHEDGGTALFDLLHDQRAEIEEALGAPLEWLGQADRKRSKIRALTDGGWSVDESEWPLIQDRLVDLAYRMTDVLVPRIEKLPK